MFGNWRSSNYQHFRMPCNSKEAFIEKSMLIQTHGCPETFTRRVFSHNCSCFSLSFILGRLLVKLFRLQGFLCKERYSAPSLGLVALCWFSSLPFGAHCLHLWLWRSRLANGL